ncbi:hypothetical protein EDD22DRAFT_850687, partial [Suillus occidentalis]
MEYLYRGWLLETSRRLNVFDKSLHHETDLELGKAEQELRWLVHVLVGQAELPRAVATPQDPGVQLEYLTAARDGTRRALDHADAEIAMLKEFPIGDSDDKSEAIRVTVPVFKDLMDKLVAVIVIVHLIPPLPDLVLIMTGPGQQTLRPGSTSAYSIIINKRNISHSSVQGSSAPLPDPQVTVTYDQGDHNDCPPVLPHFERYGSVMQMQTPQPPQPTFSGYYQGNLTQAVPPAPAPAAPSDHSRSVTPTVYAPQPTLVVALGGHQGDPSRRDNVHLPPPVTIPSHHRHPVTQMHTPQTTFDDYQGNAPQNLPIPSDHSRSMYTPQSTLSNYQGNAALVPIIPPDLSRSHSLYTPSGPYPGAMQTPIPGNWLPSLPPNPHSCVASAAQMNTPPPTLNDYDGSLLLSVMVPSQDLRPSDLALRLQPPPAFADYRRSFAAPVMSMDGISSLPSVAPDDVQPLTILTPPPIFLSSQTSEKRKGDWRFIDILALFWLQGEQLIWDAVNDCAMIKRSERESLAQVALANAVNDCLEKTHNIRPRLSRVGEKNSQRFGQRWAAKNAESLYMKLSAPPKLIMAACKEIALIVIDRAYDLRPSRWSNIESKLKRVKIKDLIGDVTWPLKFIFKKDEITDQWMAFEHDAILDVVIGVVRKLNYWDYVYDLDNLYCTAAAAIYCVLTQFSSGWFNRAVDFTAESFKFMYDLLMGHIINVIKKDESLAKRWVDVKAYTTTILSDLCPRRDSNTSILLVAAVLRPSWTPNEMATTLSQTHTTPTTTDADLLKRSIPSWPSELRRYSEAVMHDPTLGADYSMKCKQVDGF